MAEENGLDAFLSSDEENSSKNDNKQSGEVNLEDEFSKLLASFVNQNSNEETKSEDEKESESLDDFGTSEDDNQTSLDSFETKSSPNKDEDNPGLDSFIKNSEQPQDSSGELDSFVTDTSVEETKEDGNLKSEEQELARAVSNFQDAVRVMANNKNLKQPKTDYTESMLYPNYKPSVGKKIAEYLLSSWDMIKKYDPDNMKLLPADAGDEEYLSFAESLSDTSLQLAIISYVEILINIEICEVSYEQRRDLVQKNRIKRELYEEYMELQERKKMFIQKLKEKNFPIDEDKLISNYFHVAQKDPDGAFEALTKNPAMFSPIQFEKIHPRFFGLIKVSPEDGIKANQKIGAFIKKLKV